MKKTEAGQNLVCFLASAEACALPSQRLETRPFTSESSHPVHESQTNLVILRCVCMTTGKRPVRAMETSMEGERKKRLNFITRQDCLTLKTLGKNKQKMETNTLNYWDLTNCVANVAMRISVALHTLEWCHEDRHKWQCSSTASPFHPVCTTELSLIPPPGSFSIHSEEFQKHFQAEICCDMYYPAIQTGSISIPSLLQ